MMSRRLTSEERELFSLTAAFVRERLSESGTVSWALSAPSEPEQDAIKAVLAQVTDIVEPWSSAWRLIKLYWRSGDDKRTSHASQTFEIKQRLGDGPLTISLAEDIASVVAPRLSLRPLNESASAKKKFAPRSASDLMRIEITSEEVIDPAELGLEAISDAKFLSSLVRAVEGAVDYGLEIAEQAGWKVESRAWQPLVVRRVYYVRERTAEAEPDEYARGLAPAIKLLSAVADRLADVEPSIAAGLVRGWYLRGATLYQRLWSALAFREDLVSAEEVAGFLLSLSSDDFWSIHSFPEFAELRARRFGHLSADSQTAILRRLRRGPPKRRWRDESDKDRLEHARQFWKLRELRRIEQAGWELPRSDTAWVRDHLPEFSELKKMRLDEGFDPGVQAYWKTPDPDASYDAVRGSDRLSALEAALGAARTFDNDPAEQANDWIRAQANTHLLIEDFGSVPKGGTSYPLVWERFGWAHSANNRNLSDAQRDAEATAVIRLLEQLSASTISRAIQGITYWMDSWVRALRDRLIIVPLWFRVWPIAQRATNAEDARDQDNLQNSAWAARGEEPMDLDTLNTPAGRLVGCFFGMCPNLTSARRPFETIPALKEIRETLGSAPGRSGLIASHRIIEILHYFAKADRHWVVEKILPELEGTSERTLILWRAVSRNIYVDAVVSVLGEAITQRACDESLARATRGRLTKFAVISALHSLLTGKRPKLRPTVVQQMIRGLEPELRPQAAEDVAQFLRHHADKPQEAFRKSVRPFLENIWPQERSLVTPGVSKAFAEIPARSGEDFVSAVRTVSRFLVPFDCWSLLDYGLFAGAGEPDPLQFIDTRDSASALLSLLDTTIGNSEKSIVPYDLNRALKRVANVSADLAESVSYRRLAAAARL